MLRSLGRTVSGGSNWPPDEGSRDATSKFSPTAKRRANPGDTVDRALEADRGLPEGRVQD